MEGKAKPTRRQTRARRELLGNLMASTPGRHVEGPVGETLSAGDAKTMSSKKRVSFDYSGTRVLVTLLHAMKKRGAKKGLTSLCLGGGNAVAMSVSMK